MKMLCLSVVSNHVEKNNNYNVQRKINVNPLCVNELCVNYNNQNVL